MADWPEFEVDLAGDTSTWTRRGDLTRYVESLRLKLSYVMMKPKRSSVAPEHRIV
jgi:hypothetical protein